MTVQEYIQKIKDLRKILDLDKAMEVCNEAISNYPQAAELYFLKALIIWNQSKIVDLPREEFSSLLKYATDLDPHYSEPHKLWAYANEQMGNLENALLGYTRAFEADPKDFQALEMQAEITRKLGDYEKALELFDKLISTFTEINEWPYISRGAVKIDLKDLNGAIADFNKALEMNPKARAALGMRGECKRNLKDFKGAEEDFTKVISLYPNDTLGYEERAKVYLKEYKLLKALRDLQQVLFLDSERNDLISIIIDLQKLLWARVPSGTDVLHVTLETGYKAKRVFVGGEVITFLEFDTVDEAYENIAQAMVQSLEGKEWKKAVLRILMDRYPETIGYKLEYYNEGDKPEILEMTHFPDKEKVERVYMLFNGKADDWNKIEFILKKDGSFSMSFKCEESQIYTEAKNNNWDKVKELLETGDELRSRCPDGRTFMEYALQSEDTPQEIKELIYKKMSESVNANNGGNTTIKFDVRPDNSKNLAPGAEGVTLDPEDEIFMAVKTGDMERVKELLASGNVNINNVGHFGETALMTAVEHNQTEVAKILLSAGADANHVNAFKKTILMSAVSKGNTEMVKALIDGGADVNYFNDMDGSVLKVAADKNQPEIMKILIAAGADINYKDKFGDTILLAAVSKNKADAVKVLITAGADTNFEKNHESILGTAVKKKNPEIVKALIDGGANVNFKDVFRRNILELAQTFNVEQDDETDKKNRAEIVNLLKTAGAVDEKAQKADPCANITAENVNTPDRFGMPPLAKAVRGKKTEDVKALIAKGADVNWFGTFDESLLMMALKDNQLEIAKILIDAGANINHADKSKNTALMTAVKKNKIDVIKFLIAEKADVNCVNKANETPLLVTVQNNKADIAKMLIEAGADVNYKNNFGKTVLQVAQMRKRPEIEEMLKAAGATV